ncbi:MAG: hypothetical protein FWD71_07075 [Oscillospiraceae bacterium]|nr:hypothetical protein [Oscillospiraceae bacterium]
MKLIIRRFIVLIFLFSVVLPFGSCGDVTPGDDSNSDNILLDMSQSVEIVDTTIITTSDNTKAIIADNAQPVTLENTYNDVLTAYAAFLANFHTESEKMIARFALRDLDNDGIPELLIVQENGSTGLDAVLSVYTYASYTICKLGDYSNAQTSFVSALWFSNNPMYPGIFDSCNDWDMDRYSYVYIKDRKLVSEELWDDDHTTGPPHKVEISSDRQLIDESVNVYADWYSRDNILEMYPINVINDAKIAAQNGIYRGKLAVGINETLIISNYTAQGFHFDFTVSAVPGDAIFSDDGYAYYNDSSGQGINFKFSDSDVFVESGSHYGLDATYIHDEYPFTSTDMPENESIQTSLSLRQR